MDITKIPKSTTYVLSLFKMDIVDQIIQARKERGISQQKLAELTGIFQSVIARVESKKSSPTVEFLNKILPALDLELTLKSNLYLPNEVEKVVCGLPYSRVYVGRSSDKVYKFDEQYILKISEDIDSLKLEKEKNEWVNQYINGSKTVSFLIENGKAYYLRTYIKGRSLEEKRFIHNPHKLILILKEVNEVLRSLDKYNCPFISTESSGKDFVHGDLCLPNIIVDNKDRFAGFVDLSDAGLGDRNLDYAWLLWSLEYNLKTNSYNEELINELNIKISDYDYAKYVLPHALAKDK